MDFTSLYGLYKGFIRLISLVFFLKHSITEWCWSSGNLVVTSSSDSINTDDIFQHVIIIERDERWNLYRSNHLHIIKLFTKVEICISFSSKTRYLHDLPGQSFIQPEMIWCHLANFFDHPVKETWSYRINKLLEKSAFLTFAERMTATTR